MSTNAVVQQQPSRSKPMQRNDPDEGYEVESYERETKASASAGLNLNVFGAISGVFGSKSRKDTAPDGSSVEHREEQARAKGAARGDGQAAAAGMLHDRESKYSHIPITEDGSRIEDAPQRKMVEGRK